MLGLRTPASPERSALDVWPVKPPPPFGKSITDSTTTVAPANISVTSAR